MSERPILFSGPMVRAILEGRKSQTRRAITLQNSYIDGHRHANSRSQKFGRLAIDFWKDLDWSRAWKDGGPSPAGNPGPYLRAPYPRENTAHRIYPQWQPGDPLWVRETFCGHWGKPLDGARVLTEAGPVRQAQGVRAPVFASPDEPLSLYYRADRDTPPLAHLKWTPPIHMPRWASRLTLRITDVRVERLQEISEEDAKAEGIYIASAPSPWTGKQFRADEDRGFASPEISWHHTAVGAYADLWRSINGKGSWDANPWVWVVEFERVPA